MSEPTASLPLRRRVPPVPGLVEEYVSDLTSALAGFIAEADRIDRWGSEIRQALSSGGRLLAAGNGGSAATAQHLTSELVGRLVTERPPFSAIALHADTSSLTAIANDYGFDDTFARQVTAHGRSGDILLLISTSGNSPNIVAAAHAGRERRMTVWGLCGRKNAALDGVCDDCLHVDAITASIVQEIHLVVVHLLCTIVDSAHRPTGVQQFTP